MDASYDAAEAVKALELRREMEMVNDRNKHVCALTNEDGWEGNVEIMRLNNPSSWRMVKVSSGAEKRNSVEEYQIHIQGIIEDKRLPPIRGENNSQKKRQHLRQSVTLGGFESEKFALDVERIMDIIALFSRHVPGIQQVGVRQVGDRTIIEVGNRIFTPRHEAPTMEAAEVDHLMDENGFIEQVSRSDPGFVYGEENVVHYGEEKIESDGTRRVVKISPQKLHIGDIVDVGFSVMGIGKGREAKARLMLRNITLLDARFTQAWLKTKAKNQLKMTSVRTSVTLSKRPGFEDEREDAQRKIARVDGMDE
ncbi:hypothetical protein F5878DRAFT_664559 [Lentinula raphanica]|uniref:Uncharacterized protein n=1 Tax=Lentinula raphanica TaxID=153919 RepID=A0AA38U929_9AGAR|nr:hypothetical protein F5878DRAFT_664559 [Lentinula raphanica]